MTGSQDDFDDASLDALFAEAQADRPAPSAALLDRITQDAVQVQTESAPVAEVTPQIGLWGQLLDGIGGWTGFGGLVTATAAGLYIGFAQPDLVDGTTAALDEQDFVSTEILPGDDLFFEEG